MSPLSYIFYIPKNQLRKTSYKKLLSLGIESMFIHKGKLFSQIDGVAEGSGSLTLYPHGPLCKSEISTNPQVFKIGSEPKLYNKTLTRIS